MVFDTRHGRVLCLDTRWQGSAVGGGDDHLSRRQVCYVGCWGRWDRDLAALRLTAMRPIPQKVTSPKLSWVKRAKDDRLYVHSLRPDGPVDFANWDQKWSDTSQLILFSRLVAAT